MEEKIVATQLPKKEIIYTDFFREKHPKKILIIERVLFLDPTPPYKRLGDKVDRFKRHAGVQMEDLFPKTEDGSCACGCDNIPKSGEGWHRKWATDECSSFAGDVLSIINNYFGKPAYYMKYYSGYECSECGDDGKRFGLELDHIVGVKHGGGGCWLSNYRWLCKGCHNHKTNKDFKRKEFKDAGSPQIKS